METPEIPRERRHGVAHFVDCIRHNKPVDAPHSAVLNVMVHEVVEAAYESILDGGRRQPVLRRQKLLTRISPADSVASVA